MSRKSSALIGALVADAAGLGLHWLYDVDRLAQVVGDGPAAFTPINAANFKDTKGYFAHANRRDGQLSQYGETLALAMRSIADNTGFDTANYQTAFTAHFGPGGTYIGYIDRPTRGTLENLAAGQTHPSGIDDDQHPAIATLPAIVARYGNDKAMLKAAREVTNVNTVADHYAELIALTLQAVINGAPLADALASAAKKEPLLQAALDTDIDPVTYGETTNRACHLPQGTPLSWRILSHTTSYQEAIETNIRTGGDSAGRAMILGAVAGAAYGVDAIPKDWLNRTTDAVALTKLAHSL